MDEPDLPYSHPFLMGMAPMPEEPFGRSRLSEELESLRAHAQAALGVPVVWTSIAELVVGDEVVERVEVATRGVRWQSMTVRRISGHRIDDHFVLMLVDPKGREELYGCWGTDPVLVTKRRKAETVW